MIDWALKPDRGSAVITATSQPEFRYEKNQCVLRVFLLQTIITELLVTTSQT